MFETVLQYLPTAIASLAIGYLTYRATRAGQKDQTRIQAQANKVAETQQLLDGQKSLTEQHRSDALAERARRIDTEKQLDEARRRADGLEDQIEELQNRYCKELRYFADRLYEVAPEDDQKQIDPPR